ncbi:MAG: DUF2213 domain-containing protein [Candidatus Krumholzibacteria bacterium]|nr:DUF2213 domain-containing protein [Candidatus Krumholzibacteria bacterium]
METHEGREWLVAPVVALVEGVVAGSIGPVLVPADELAVFVEAWNGIPLTVNHPSVNGEPVSANSPAVLEKQSIGRLFNMQFNERRIQGELWLDMAKCKAMGGEALQILNRVQAGEALEVSTGYFCETEAQKGTFEGKEYWGVTRNIRPDHLALLPNDIGACSWADGCGAPRTNSGGLMDSVKTAIVSLAEKLGLQIQTKHEAEAVKMADTVTPTPNPCGCPHLSVANTAAQPPVTPPATPPIAPPAAPQTLEQAIADIKHPELKSMIENMLREKQTARAKIIEGLTGNARCTLTKDQLSAIDDATLDALGKTFAAIPADYTGKGVATNAAGGNQDEVFEAPAIVTAPFEKQ